MSIYSIIEIGHYFCIYLFIHLIEKICENNREDFSKVFLLNENIDIRVGYSEHKISGLYISLCLKYICNKMLANVS